MLDNLGHSSYCSCEEGGVKGRGGWGRRGGGGAGGGGEKEDLFLKKCSFAALFTILKNGNKLRLQLTEESLDNVFKIFTQWNSLCPLNIL